MWLQVNPVIACIVLYCQMALQQVPSYKSKVKLFMKLLFCICSILVFFFPSACFFFFYLSNRNKEMVFCSFSARAYAISAFKTLLCNLFIYFALCANQLYELSECSSFHLVIISKAEHYNTLPTVERKSSLLTDRNFKNQAQDNRQPSTMTGWG